LLVLSLAQLTLGIDPNLRASSAHPISSVLWLLTVLIGVPFVTLSATSRYSKRGTRDPRALTRTIRRQRPRSPIDFSRCRTPARCWRWSFIRG